MLRGASQVLVRNEVTGDVPIVTTTNTAPRVLLPTLTLHWPITSETFSKNGLLVVNQFNNAIIECYDKHYTTMGFHSDQALDLDENTCIALYSCYQHPNQRNSLRKLVVESKTDPEETFDIPMLHNSVILFTAATNRHYRHKIVLDSRTVGKGENEWLGLTLRTSKTFVSYKDDVAMLANGGKPLVLGSTEQCLDFYKIRKQENEQIDFQYPGGEDEITFTISPSDLMPPV